MKTTTTSIRPWALRHVKEQQLPRQELRTVPEETQVRRELLRALDGHSGSERGVISSIQQDANFQWKQHLTRHQLLTRSPRKLQRQRWIHAQECRTMEDLVKTVDSFTPRMRDQVFALVGLDVTSEDVERLDLSRTQLDMDAKEVQLQGRKQRAQSNGNLLEPQDSSQEPRPEHSSSLRIAMATIASERLRSKAATTITSSIGEMTREEGGGLASQQELSVTPAQSHHQATPLAPAIPPLQSVYKDKERYTHFLRKPVAASEANHVVAPLPAIRKRGNPLTEAYDEEWQESDVRHLALSLNHWVNLEGGFGNGGTSGTSGTSGGATTSGGGGANAGDALLTAGHSLTGSNASMVPGKKGDTNGDVTEEADFETLFRECHPVHALRSKTVTKLGAKLKVSYEKDPPDALLNSLAHQLGIVIHDYEGQRRHRDAEQRRRVDALQQFYHEREEKDAQQAGSMSKRISSQVLLGLIANAKSRSLRNSVREPAMGSSSSRSAARQSTAGTTMSAGRQGPAVGMSQEAAATSTNPTNSTTNPTFDKLDPRTIRYGNWYTPVSKWKVQHVQPNKDKEATDMHADFARYCPK